jgi:hypothetical protein
VFRLAFIYLLNRNAGDGFDLLQQIAGGDGLNEVIPTIQADISCRIVYNLHEGVADAERAQRTCARRTVEDDVTSTTLGDDGRIAQDAIGAQAFGQSLYHARVQPFVRDDIVVVHNTESDLGYIHRNLSRPNAHDHINL